ncbi:hypothetical protein [Desulfofustis limnaeus]|uniref:Uncharacterized protein n=1 Tax=Desulfofustis limnaeus TaxID=2740163 RepID=A0ABN6MAL6_9BACT|nr:hypothetical protein [Desulfofustis limnaeus]MDX9895910.1 hypothetical protein [Desulfofustis sp.]BDD88502.1 hypothetical protein DPPLL_28670 [Desulfofustis limnaeus]
MTSKSKRNNDRRINHLCREECAPAVALVAAVAKVVVTAPVAVWAAVEVAVAADVVNSAESSRRPEFSMKEVVTCQDLTRPARWESAR